MDPPADERERRAGGQSPDGYLAVGERVYSMLRHLPMVVGLVPVARGGLVVRGGARVVNGRGPQNSSPRNSHRDERDHSRTPVLLLRACSGIFIHLPHETHTALALLCSRTALLSDTTSANANPPSLRDIYLLPHGEGPWRESSRCLSLIGPWPHPTGAEPWPLFGDPTFSTWLHSRRVTVSMLRWCKS